MKAWTGGRVIDVNAAVAADDRGLLLGDGLFETILVEDGRAALLARHVARMTTSAARLGFATPSSLEETVAAALVELHAADGRPRRAALRVTLSRGRGRGLTPRPGPSLLTCTFDALPDVERGAPASPVAGVIVATPRIDPLDPLAGHKTLSSMARVEARRAAVAASADVALLATIDGDVAEADAANLFVVLYGELVTPPLDRGVLPGITRARCLEAERCAERRVSPEELMRASEAFLTSSLDGVRPLASVNGRAFASPGPAALRLARRLAAAEGSRPREPDSPQNGDGE